MLVWLGIGTVGAFSEFGNEPTGSIRCGEIFK